MSESPKSVKVRLSPDDAMRLVEKEAVARQLEKSAEMCEEVLAELARSRTGSVPAGSGSTTRRGSLEEQAARATVGLLLVGRQVFGVLPGGPASAAGITKGDVLLEVDGMEVTNETARDAVVGDDVVGSRMRCSVMRDSGDKSVVEVEMERMDSRQVGHKRKLYDLFARITRKGVATGNRDLQDVAVELVDAWEEVEGEYCERIESMGGVIESKITKVAEETRKAGGYLKKKYEHSFLQAISPINSSRDLLEMHNLPSSPSNSTNRSYEKEKEELVAAHEKEKKEARGSCEKEKEELIAAHEKDREEARGAHELEKVDLIIAHEREKKEARGAHEKENEELIAAHEREKKELEERYMEKEREVEAKVDAHQRVEERLMEQISALVKVTEGMESAIEEKERETVERDAEFERREEEQREQIADVFEEKRGVMEEKERELTGIREVYEKEMEGLRESLAALREERDWMKAACETEKEAMSLALLSLEDTLRENVLLYDREKEERVELEARMKEREEERSRLETKLREEEEEKERLDEMVHKTALQVAVYRDEKEVLEARLRDVEDKAGAYEEEKGKRERRVKYVEDLAAVHEAEVSALVKSMEEMEVMMREKEGVYEKEKKEMGLLLEEKRRELQGVRHESQKELEVLSLRVDGLVEEREEIRRAFEREKMVVEGLVEEKERELVLMRDALAKEKRERDEDVEQKDIAARTRVTVVLEENEKEVRALLEAHEKEKEDIRGAYEEEMERVVGEKLQQAGEMAGEIAREMKKRLEEAQERAVDDLSGKLEEAQERERELLVKIGKGEEAQEKAGELQGKLEEAQERERELQGKLKEAQGKAEEDSAHTERVLEDMHVALKEAMSNLAECECVIEMERGMKEQALAQLEQAKGSVAVDDSRSLTVSRSDALLAECRAELEVERGVRARLESELKGLLDVSAHGSTGGSGGGGGGGGGGRGNAEFIRLQSCLQLTEKRLSAKIESEKVAREEQDRLSRELDDCRSRLEESEFRADGESRAVEEYRKEVQAGADEIEAARKDAVGAKEEAERERERANKAEAGLVKEKGTRDLVEKYNERLAEEKASAEQSLKREQAAHAEALARCEDLSRSSQKKQALCEEAQKREEALLQEARQREEAHELRLQVALGERDEAVAELTAAAIQRRVSKRDACTDVGVRTAEKGVSALVVTLDAPSGQITRSSDEITQSALAPNDQSPQHAFTDQSPTKSNQIDGVKSPSFERGGGQPSSFSRSNSNETAPGTNPRLLLPGVSSPKPTGIKSPVPTVLKHVPARVNTSITDRRLNFLKNALVRRSTGSLLDEESPSSAEGTPKNSSTKRSSSFETLNSPDLDEKSTPAPKKTGFTRSSSFGDSISDIAHYLARKHESDGKGEGGAGEGADERSLDFIPLAVRDLVSGKFLWGDGVNRGGVSPVMSPGRRGSFEKDSPRSSNSGIVSSSGRRRLEEVAEMEEEGGGGNHNRDSRVVAHTEEEKMEGKGKTSIDSGGGGPCNIPSYHPLTFMARRNDSTTAKSQIDSSDPPSRHADGHGGQPRPRRTHEILSRPMTSAFRLETPHQRVATPGSAKFASPQLRDRHLGGGYYSLRNREGGGNGGGERELGRLPGGGDAPVKMCGVGLHIDAPTEGGGADNLLPFIERVVEGGAASASRKVFAGDTILEIQGRSALGMSMEDIFEAIMGPEGSGVRLGVCTNSGQMRTVLLSRSPLLPSPPQSVDGYVEVGNNGTSVGLGHGDGHNGVEAGDGEASIYI